MLYVVKTGCQGRQMPTNFPPWLSVHRQFRAWRDGGVWERVTKALREQGRKASGRNATPSVAILDSQSAKTAPKRFPYCCREFRIVILTLSLPKGKNPRIFFVAQYSTPLVEML